MAYLSWKQIWPLTLMAFLGCTGTDSENLEPVDPLSVPLVPVTGTIVLDGEPLQGAVVTFLPSQGAASNGETDEQGHYALQTYNREGAPVGEYKVAVSYMVSAEGKPQGLGNRSSMSLSADALTATERLQPEYADLGRTRLKATVGNQGGQFNFEVEVLPEELSAAAVEGAEVDPDGALEPEQE